MEAAEVVRLYTPALTSARVPWRPARFFGTLSACRASATVSMTAQTGFYQVFVVTEGPNGNLGDGCFDAPPTRTPRKAGKCLVPQSDSSDDYYLAGVPSDA